MIFRLLCVALFLSSLSQASESLLGAGTTLGAPKLIGRGTGLDKAANPTMSLTGLVLGAYGTGAKPKGLSLQEVEAQFTGAVDSYFYGNAAVTADGAGRVGIREIYAHTLFIPHVTIKAGKFLLNFGANNLIHPHAQPLIDLPAVNESFFGAGGLNSVGMEVAWRLPLPWHADLIASAVRAEGTTAFTTTNPETIASQARLENLVLLAPDTVLAWGVSQARGRGIGANLQYWGTDLTLKLGSPKTKEDLAFAWTTELISRGKTDWGIYSTPLLRLMGNWWAGGRVDYLEAPAAGKTTAQNLILAFVPSEFSTIRGQVGWAQRPAGVKEWQALIQYSLTLGSHPSHAY